MELTLDQRTTQAIPEFRGASAIGGSDPSVGRYDPDLWTDEFYFLNEPGQSDIHSDLFYDYRTSVELSFDPSEPEAYRRDVPKAEVHIADGGPLALDTAADHIAQLVRGFLK